MNKIINRFQPADQKKIIYLRARYEDQTRAKIKKTRLEISKILWEPTCTYDYRELAYALLNIINRYFHDNQLDIEQYVQNYPSDNIDILPNAHSLWSHYQVIYENIHQGELSFGELRKSVRELCQIAEKLDKIS